MIFLALCLMKESRKLTIMNSNKAKSILMNKYKSKYFYWEYILFIRRVLIAFFAVTANDLISNYIFLGFVIFCTGVQYFSNPFLIKQNDAMEMILLLCLIFIVGAEITSALDNIVINIMVSILIIIPIPVLCYYICIFYLKHDDEFIDDAVIDVAVKKDRVDTETFEDDFNDEDAKIQNGNIIELQNINEGVQQDHNKKDLHIGPFAD